MQNTFTSGKQLKWFFTMQINLIYAKSFADDLRTEFNALIISELSDWIPAQWKKLESLKKCSKYK